MFNCNCICLMWSYSGKGGIYYDIVYISLSWTTIFHLFEKGKWFKRQTRQSNNFSISNWEFDIAAFGRIWNVWLKNQAATVVKTKQDQTGLDRSARYTLDWTLNWAVLDCTDQRGRGEMSHRINSDIWWVIWWFEKQARWSEEFNEDKRPVLESLGVDGGGLGVPGGQGEHLGDPMEPLGWFDESSDDSWGI